MRRFYSILICGLLLAKGSLAQDTTRAAFDVEMDEVVIQAAKSGWDVQAFIRRMQTDTTFYKAFVNLKVVAFESENAIDIFDDSKKVVASLHNNATQQAANGCRTLTVKNEVVTGDYYNKNGTPRYYTGELFENLFFRKGAECGLSDVIARSNKAKGRFEKNKEQLKQLVFNPGSKITGIPFVGDKASIFEPDIAKMYDFKLTFVVYENEECYLFRAIPKEAYKDDVVFNQLDTWFRKSDYSIMARDYSLSYHTMVYDFDVQMKVRLEKQGSRLVPSTIDYRGNWHVMARKRERAKLNIVFDY
jgi:hypothetical protein